MEKQAILTAANKMKKHNTFEYVPGFGWEVDTNDVPLEERELTEKIMACMDVKEGMSIPDWIAEYDKRHNEIINKLK